MGYGDELMGAGIAKGAAARGKRVAFGDGMRILWTRHAHEIFQGNPNVAPPGQERSINLEWVRHYVGHRQYARSNGGRWIWDNNFRIKPGEIFLTGVERAAALNMPGGYILVEPSVKKTAPNKQWPRERYAAVVHHLLGAGYKVAQFAFSGPPVHPKVKLVQTHSFRHAIACLERASMYLGPEGGLHHAAAAIDKPAVVIFGGFISPKLTGYENHTNLYAGGDACGVIGRPCAHCQKAMASITVEMVVAAALSTMRKGHNVAHPAGVATAGNL